MEEGKDREVETVRETRFRRTRTRTGPKREERERNVRTRKSRVERKNKFARNAVDIINPNGPKKKDKDPGAERQKRYGNQAGRQAEKNPRKMEIIDSRLTDIEEGHERKTIESQGDKKRSTDYHRPQPPNPAARKSASHDPIPVLVVGAGTARTWTC
jgi:hypothetical protein